MKQRSRAWMLTLGSLSLVLGCTQSDPTAAEPRIVAGHWVPLVDPSGWSLAEAQDDPLPQHRPDEVVCSQQPWHVVGGGIEADTGACNYVSLTTPVAGGFSFGDPLRVDVWWSTLASVEPASGHLALFVGGQALWETQVEIPGPADARRFEFSAPFTALADEDVTFHLHNHGFNTWTLAAFSVLQSNPSTQP